MLCGLKENGKVICKHLYTNRTNVNNIGQKTRENN